MSPDVRTAGKPAATRRPGRQTFTAGLALWLAILSGYQMVLLPVAIWNIAEQTGYIQFKDIITSIQASGMPPAWLRTLIEICVVPTVMLMITAPLLATCIPRFRGRRALHQRACSRDLVAGVLAGITTIIVAAAIIGILNWGRTIGDVNCMAAAGMTAAPVLILLRLRHRPGTCRYCGYDIAASLSSGRCPECGEAL